MGKVTSEDRAELLADQIFGLLDESEIKALGTLSEDEGIPAEIYNRIDEAMSHVVRPETWAALLALCQYHTGFMARADREYIRQITISNARKGWDSTGQPYRPLIEWDHPEDGTIISPMINWMGASPVVVHRSKAWVVPAASVIPIEGYDGLLKVEPLGGSPAPVANSMGEHSFGPDGLCNLCGWPGVPPELLAQGAQCPLDPCDQCLKADCDGCEAELGLDRFDGLAQRVEFGPDGIPLASKAFVAQHGPYSEAQDTEDHIKDQLEAQRDAALDGQAEADQRHQELCDSEAEAQACPQCGAWVSFDDHSHGEHCPGPQGPEHDPGQPLKYAASLLHPNTAQADLDVRKQAYNELANLLGWATWDEASSMGELKPKPPAFELTKEQEDRHTAEHCWAAYQRLGKNSCRGCHLDHYCPKYGEAFDGGAYEGSEDELDGQWDDALEDEASQAGQALSIAFSEGFEALAESLCPECGFAEGHHYKCPRPTVDRIAALPLALLDEYKCLDLCLAELREIYLIKASMAELISQREAMQVGSIARVARDQARASLTEAEAEALCMGLDIKEIPPTYETR